VDLRGDEQPLHPGDDDVHADGEQDRRLRRCPEDLCPLEAPRPLRRGGAACEPGGDQADADAAGVHDHVPGVDQQSQGPGDDGPDHLGQQDRRGDAERHEQGAFVRAGMPVVVSHAPIVGSTTDDLPGSSA
jgi:hypothetical protein